MIIVCPDCTARFVVKAEKIGEKGRKVKCAKCKHFWFQKPDLDVLNAAKKADIAETPKEVEPVPEGANVPAIKGAAIPLYLKAIAATVGIVFVLGVSLVSANSILPGMSGYYGFFGIYYSADLSLYDVAVEKVESGKYQDLMVSGKIANESESPKYIPDVRLTILGEGGEKLKTITLGYEGTIEPGEKVDFENRIPRLPKMATKVVMDLGSLLDLASR
jgi:predicted Zn finger-like uncharacterized protein